MENDVNMRPISEDDLHAFVDEALSDRRRADVASYLDAHPDVATRVATWRAERQQLRTALAPLAAEPLPPELNLRRMVKTHMPATRWRKWRPPFWALATSASVLLCMGGGVGWILRGMDADTHLTALEQQAIASYNVYAPDRSRPVELRAENTPLLKTWILERTGQRIAIPELTASGYRFMGGRIVAGVHGAATLLMYDDDKGTRLVVLAQAAPERPDSTMTPVTAGNVHGFSWSDQGLAYSVVAAATPESLRPLANAIRRQAKVL